MNSNIFGFRIGDATAYLVFYIVIPVVVTYISLKVLSADMVSGAYCYVSILVSILNGIYDASNRWDFGIKCKKNTKIFIIYVSNAIVGIYCIYIIFYVLIKHEMVDRFDWVLLAYLGTCLVAVWDAAAAFIQDMSLKEAVTDHGTGGKG